MWVLRRAEGTGDPRFHTKAQAVCHLYLNLPADTVLFSVDAKTSMQAKSRKRTHPADLSPASSSAASSNTSATAPSP